MKLENKAKAYKVLAAGLKYGGIFLCAAAIPALLVMVASGVLFSTALIPTFAMFVFGGTALYSTHVAEVYRDGYNAELELRNKNHENEIQYETEHVYNLTKEEEKEIIDNCNTANYTVEAYTSQKDDSKEM